MEHVSLRNAAITASVIVLSFFTFWEYQLRSTGIGISYDDGPELWSDKRAKVYLPSNQATVFIGSSRNKYDLDTKTWQTLTGEQAIQLAFEGTSPIPALTDLAEDSAFKGKLVVDVTEGLVFSNNPYNFKSINKAIEYYKKITPAQKFSFQVNKVLESQLLFLERSYYSLNALLQRKLPLKERPGINHEPYFPIDFGRVNFDRQDLMTDKFVKDTSLQHQVIGIWDFFSKMASKEPPPAPKTIDSIFSVIQRDVAKITARGGKVLFVRTPSSGPYWELEKQVFPRQALWDRILKMTGAPGIHFADYPALSGFICPENSHLSPADAVVYTKALVQILSDEKGWTFAKK